MSASATILLVDDNTVDRDAIRRAFRTRGLANPIVEARDGVEALEFIRGGPHTPAIPRPFFVLTDIKMPRMDGHGLIHEIRTDPELASTVIFVLTTSETDEDREQAYAAHITGFMVKQNIGDDLKKLVILLGLFDQIVEPPN